MSWRATVWGCWLLGGEDTARAGDGFEVIPVARCAVSIGAQAHLPLRRFWVSFDVNFGEDAYGAQLGCGITAEHFAEAMRLAQHHVFRGDAMPRIVSVIEDVDVSTLEANHVQPNIGDPSRKGVWFPAYQ